MNYAETPCAKPVSSLGISSRNTDTRIQAADPELPQERPLTVDDTNEVLLKPQLESIASSSEICNALKDESLRKLICAIDDASDPDSELEKAMGVEAFCIFTDKIQLIFNTPLSSRLKGSVDRESK
ncbi:conserved hypothetical protein [Ricinus communis]|uniref:Uncharacterized protein n=1 Tax=Ricinus communis TaxID=3988 RepID=B9S580_RICCO|nr:conserved hypothetical protein [Ricinus communis]